MLEAERIAKDPALKGYADLNQLFADFIVFHKYFISTFSLFYE